ncbi:hypothetical protein MD484_g2648, partial [Candolleomyces efflorescens]
MLTPTTLVEPSFPDQTSESKVTVGPKALKDVIDHFPVSRGAKSDPQLVWTFSDSELTLKSSESSVENRGRDQLSTELVMSSEEFDFYDIYAVPITFAFHLREFNTEIDVLKSTGLGIEEMNADEFADMLDGEGEEVDFGFVPPSQEVEQMELEENDFDLLDEFGATQSSGDNRKAGIVLRYCPPGLTFLIICIGSQAFQPLFED